MIRSHAHSTALALLLVAAMSAITACSGGAATGPAAASIAGSLPVYA